MFRRTIKFYLFFTFSLIILIPFLVLSFYLISTESQKINSRTFAALEQNCSSIATSAENEIAQMNMVSTNIAYSYLIKDLYNQYLKDQSDFAKTKELNDLLSTTIGPNRPVDQVNIYSSVGTVIAFGLYSNIYTHPVEIMPWYEETKNNNGRGVLSYTGLDPYVSRYTTNPYGKFSLAYTRPYYDLYNNVQGYIEVKQSLKEVLAQAIAYQSVYGEQLLIFDKSGDVLYPLNDSNYKYIFNQFDDSKSSEFQEISHDGSNAYVTYIHSPYDLYFAIVISEDSLFMPTNSYITSVVLLTLVSLLIAFILSYIAANKITVPIDHIYHEIQHISLSGYMQKRKLKTRIIELTALYDSFIKMQHELVDSLNEQLLLKNQEMQSKMLALQSQMNPHFLYNSLQTIQSMADANMDKEIIVMCQSMSNILRYISADSDPTVSLEDEIKYTKDYLCCMSIRYDNDIHYTIDIPEQMYQFKVPKLSIQSLVENAVKFCTTLLPPYLINISGRIEGNKYYITVSDNGPGFSPKALAEINTKIQKINETGLLPSLEISGMGLMNVYMRYKILFGSDAVFIIENKGDGGASIIVGGTYD